MTSAWRNDQGAATRGIIIMLNNRSRSSLSEIISHTDRILISIFQGNHATSIIVIYSHTQIPAKMKSYIDYMKNLEEL